MTSLSFERQCVAFIMGGSMTATIRPRSCRTPKLGERILLNRDERPFAWATVRYVVSYRRSEAGSWARSCGYTKRAELLRELWAPHGPTGSWS
jgi:hypothetical protein